MAAGGGGGTTNPLIVCQNATNTSIVIPYTVSVLNVGIRFLSLMAFMGKVLVEKSFGCLQISPGFCNLQSCSLTFLGTYEVNTDVTIGPLLLTYPAYVSTISTNGVVPINSFPRDIPFNKAAIVQIYSISCLDLDLNVKCQPVNVTVTSPKNLEVQR